jgi:hypothetical protein
MTDQQRAGFTRGEGYALDVMPVVDSLQKESDRNDH